MRTGSKQKLKYVIILEILRQETDADHPMQTNINPYAKVTDRVRQNYRYIDDNIWRLGKVKACTEEVLEETGEHCERPYRCWYWDTCHKNEIIQ